MGRNTLNSTAPVNPKHSGSLNTPHPQTYESAKIRGHPNMNKGTHPRTSPTSDEVLADFRRVAEIVGHRPCVREYREHGRYASATLERRLGGFEAAARLAGFHFVKRRPTATDEELRDDLERVARKVGRTPSQGDYHKHGLYSPAVVARHHGSTWKTARDHYLGLSEKESRAVSRRRSRPPDIADEKLLADLRRVARELGRRPSQSEYKRRGRYAMATLARRFGGIRGAVERAGLAFGPIPRPHKTKRTSHPTDAELTSRLTDAELLSDFRRVAKVVGRRPLISDYNAHGHYSITTLLRRFGTIRKITDAAKLFFKSASGPTDEDVIKDLRRVASELGRAPSSNEYKRLGRFHPQTVANHRKSTWKEARDHYLKLSPEASHHASYSRGGFGYRPLEDKLDSLRRAALRLGRTPHPSESRAFGINPDRLRKRAGTDWAGVVKLAGLAPPKPRAWHRSRHATPADLLADVLRIARRLGRAPSASEYREAGRYCPETVVRRALPERRWTAIQRAVAAKLPHHAEPTRKPPRRRKTHGGAEQ